VGILDENVPLPDPCGVPRASINPDIPVFLIGPAVARHYSRVITCLRLACWERRDNTRGIADDGWIIGCYLGAIGNYWQTA